MKIFEKNFDEVVFEPKMNSRNSFFLFSGDIEFSSSFSILYIVFVRIFQEYSLKSAIMKLFWSFRQFAILNLSFFLTNLSFLAIYVFLGHFWVIFGSFYLSIESFWTDLKLLILLEDEFILWLGLFQCRYFENAICNPILTNAPIGSIISFEQRTTFNLIFSGNPKVGMTSLKFQLNL